jgi:hypothetical protein
MSGTLHRIVELVQNGEVRISAHGYDEMAEDGILAGEVLSGSSIGAEPPFTSCGAFHEVRCPLPCS